MPCRRASRHAAFQAGTSAAPPHRTLHYFGIARSEVGWNQQRKIGATSGYVAVGLVPTFAARDGLWVPTGACEALPPFDDNP